MNWEEPQNLISQLYDIKGNLSSQKIKDNPDIISELNSFSELSEFQTIVEKNWAIKNKTLERPKCLCGNLTNYIKGLKSYRIYCSYACPEMKRVLLKKREATNIEKYGSITASGNKDIRDKINKTNLERYGCKNPNQNKDVINKRKQTNLEKYGCTMALHNKEIQDKAKKTNLERYGKEYYFQSDIGKEKVKAGFSKYVIENTLPNKLAKIKELYNIIPYGWDETNYKGIAEIYSFQHLDCKKIFETHLEDGFLPKCPKCHRLWHCSKIELKLRNDLTDILGGIVAYSNTELIKPYELDIVIDNKLAVEVNGTYWHRDDNTNISLLDRSNLSPIPILHFWDFELENKYDICKSIILNKAGKSNRVIYARKCDIKEVDSKEANIFLEATHIQGKSNAKYNLGLYYKNELVMVMTLGKPRFNKNYDLEIYRIASSLYTQVTGGAGRLFKHVREAFTNQSIITYADKRYSSGQLYSILGFKELKDSDSNYTWRNNNKVLSRYQTQKHKLSKILSNFDSALSETQNMINNGYHKFSDCGNKVFVTNL